MGASPSPSPDAEISIGSVLDGRYRIDALLGSGGMGRVYRGEHTGIGRAVAIKVLHADLNRNREAAQRFQREAIASGRLDHPNIVGVSDFGVLDEGPCYLVMEALDGESLGARLERDKRIPWYEAIEILRGVLAGLRHAHDRGVVHRDIKPDNIFLARKDGELIVKILDFGIAKLLAGTADDPASTRAGLTVGTPAYLSPEQAVGGEIKAASDLYSATIVLFEMIAGRAPFEDKDPLAMLGAHVSRPPPRIAELAPEVIVPPALEDVIQRGLVKAQAERINSAADYLELLEEIMTGVQGSAPIAMPAAAMGVAPTALFTPVPGAMHTPVPTPVPSRVIRTPVPVGPDTPMQIMLSGGQPVAVMMTGEQMPAYGTPTPPPLPVATRPVSLQDVPAIPRTWIKLGGVLVALLIAVAVVLAIVSRLDTSSAPGAAGGAKTEPAAVVVPMVVPGIESTVDRDTRFKAALHDLETAKTCAERKKAIPTLVDLGDKRAIPALKKARYRMGGGVLGFGDDNYNACLKPDAEAAIKTLTGAVK